MRVAHFDCFSGISGDMTLARIADLLNDDLADFGIAGDACQP